MRLESQNQICHHWKLRQAIAEAITATYFLLVVTEYLRSHHQSSYSNILPLTFKTILHNFVSKGKQLSFKHLFCRIYQFFLVKLLFNGQYFHLWKLPRLSMLNCSPCKRNLPFSFQGFLPYTQVKAAQRNRHTAENQTLPLPTPRFSLQRR